MARNKKNSRALATADTIPDLISLSHLLQHVGMELRRDDEGTKFVLAHAKDVLPQFKALITALQRARKDEFVFSKVFAQERRIPSFVVPLIQIGETRAKIEHASYFAASRIIDGTVVRAARHNGEIDWPDLETDLLNLTLLWGEVGLEQALSFMANNSTIYHLPFRKLRLIRSEVTCTEILKTLDQHGLTRLPSNSIETVAEVERKEEKTGPKTYGAFVKIVRNSIRLRLGIPDIFALWSCHESCKHLRSSSRTT